MALRGDKCLGVCGVQHSPVLEAFSFITNEMREYPGAIWRAAVKFRSLLSEYDSPVLSFASDVEETAPAFLERIGFQQVEGRVYQWQTPEP